MARKPITVLVVALPEALGTGGAVVALSGHYMSRGNGWGTTELVSFDIDIATKVKGTGPHCLKVARDRCTSIKRDPQQIFIITNGWSSAQDWVMDNDESVAGYYRVSAGDTVPVNGLQANAGFRYLVDYLTGMINPQKAGISRLTEAEMESLRTALLSTQRNIQKDANDLGQTMSNMRFEDLLVSAMAIALMQLKHSAPWDSRYDNLQDRLLKNNNYVV